MTVSAEVEVEIRRLYYAEHWKVGTIATQLSVHGDVVRRVLGQLERAGPAQPRPRLVEPYADFIAETLGRYPRLRATRLHDMLRERGYTGSVRGLREYVAEVRPRPSREAFLRVEPLVGEQSQVDWAHVGKVKVQGGERALWLFVVVLSWSRGMWGEFVFDTGAHSLTRSLVRAAEYFGGTTRQWLFDNPKAVVLERHGEAVRFHPALLEVAGHYRVQPRVCQVRKANQKGKVERSIRYLRERFLAGRTVHSVEQGNQELWAFLEEVAHARPHPTRPGRTVAECLAEEKPRLLPLPPTPASTDRVQPAHVDSTAFVRFDTNSYSVPALHAGTTLTLVADDTTVRLLEGAQEVARHTRCWGRRQLVESPSHRESLLALKRRARETKGQDRLRSAIPAVDSLFARWVEAGRNVGSLTARTLRLLDAYGDALLSEAVSEVLSRGTHDPGALAAFCEQRRRALGQPLPLEVSLGSHVPDRDVTPHPLERYDDTLRRRD
jgi:transposase